MDSFTSNSGAQTITRAIRSLKLVANQPIGSIRLVDFAEQMGLERPTAHRLLKALTAEGMLVQHAGTRRYSLGPLVFELGLAAVHQFNLHDICQPVLSKRAQQTGDTAFLFVRSGNDAVCIARRQGTYPIQTPAVPVGARQPLGVNVAVATRILRKIGLQSQNPYGTIPPYERFQTYRSYTESATGLFRHQ